MSKEIEKKYLIRENGVDFFSDSLAEIFPKISELEEEVIEKGKKIRQGYLSLEDGEALAKEVGMNIDFNPVEARLRDKAGKYFLTVKGDGSLTRNEEEKSLDQKVFQNYWSLTEGRRVEKVRLEKSYQGFTAEFDVYIDRDLIVAEIEVPSEQDANNLVPLGKDITSDKSYKNKNLAK